MEKKDSPEEDGVKMHTLGRFKNAPSAEVHGDLFSFKGHSTGCVMILEPLSPIYNYYEYVILNKGQEASIGIGMGERNYPLHRMPGWNRNSIGYHGDDGKLYHENGGGRRFGPTCTAGDRVGCGIDFDQDYSDGYHTVFFTKNGEQVGELVRMKRPLYGLYPIVGLHSAGEKVRYLGHWHRKREGLQEPMVIDSSPSNTWLRSNGIRYLEDGMTLEYCGMGDDNQDPALAQARFPLNRTNHYFELLILSTGTLGAIAIGLGKCSYELHTHPGWSHGAVGYHADDGKLFMERGMGADFGPSCSEGDRMGCGVLFDVQDESKDEEEDEANPSGSVDNHREDEDQEDSDWSSASSPAYSDGENDFGEEDGDYEVALHKIGRRLNREFGGLPNRFMPMMINRERGRRREVALRQFGLGGIRPPAIPDPFGLGVGGLGMKPPSAKDSLSMSNSSNNCVVFFTKNGETVGKTKISVPKEGLYPLVGMLSKGEKVQVDLQPLSG